MKTAADVMTRSVVDIRSDATVADAIKKMKENDVSSLLVRRDDTMHTWGFMTETDVIEKVVAKALDPASIGVTQIMSKPVITVSPGASLQECAALLTRADIRRVLVYDAKEIVGIVSTSDIFDSL
ncbi:MAG: CBS domain-containing protein [Anaerolineae bacterium]|nr:CBS domain-containing protein [Anaerolineae bacterium]